MITAAERVASRTGERTVGDDISTLVKAAAAIIALGVLVLIGVVVTDRIKNAKADNHKEVER